MADHAPGRTAEGSDRTFRLSSLCSRPVVDGAGERHGAVLDVRLVRDGPANVSGDAALRIDGLVVGRDGWVEHIGLFRHGVHGPWLLKAVARRLSPARSYLPWEQIVDPRHLLTDEAVRFTGELHDLPGQGGSST